VNNTGTRKGNITK